jgi:betaine-aldehyde dehydrogenase
MKRKQNLVLVQSSVDRRSPLLRGDDARRAQLIEVAIDSLAEEGFTGSTLARIAGRAGVSPGLIAHYFGDKDGLLEAAFRQLSDRVKKTVALHTRRAATPRERVQAIVDANLAADEFNPRTANAWLAFWGVVLHLPNLRRVQNAYQRRMLSNLRFALAQLMDPDEARVVAAMVAAMIDGVWLRAALSGWAEADSAAARALVTEFIDGRLSARVARTTDKGTKS